MDYYDPSTWTTELAAKMRETREVVAKMHAELPRCELIVWIAGNVSQCVKGFAEEGSQDLLVIKPSGCHLRRAHSRGGGRV